MRAETAVESIDPAGRFASPGEGSVTQSAKSKDKQEAEG